MTSYLSDIDGWLPPCAHGGERHALFMAANKTDALVTAWLTGHATVSPGPLATFLRRRLEELSGSDLGSEANFLYVVFRRQPLNFEAVTEIDLDSAVAEFGYGSPPSSPVEWPLVPIHQLLRTAVEVLDAQEP